MADSTADACALLGPLSRNQALLSWPFHGRFDIELCRAAILRGEYGEKDISSYSTDWTQDREPRRGRKSTDMEFLVWARAAKAALPLLWAEYDEVRKKAVRDKLEDNRRRRTASRGQACSWDDLKAEIISIRH